MEKKRLKTTGIELTMNGYSYIMEMTRFQKRTCFTEEKNDYTNVNNLVNLLLSNMVLFASWNVKKWKMFTLRHVKTRQKFIKYYATEFTPLMYITTSARIL